ncbi:uncharacterized protein L969DRAFT_16625 [Mixia osmundae IAM 14324]|uniref:Translocation protein SEC62 n=1 Tax=Mixia osmundae (strain CBS 9802 / IAM 14324 / JCM 22182 / KY 12970) TaxID=764103 RepID=G7E9K1_MIXOS|nr:uncharacterized protein L969DRAFT_16625 [Mixia osmundae IAM 14324]KEI39952.1 hypothetical protein L969DRAFT_16625 [Mixia osmundae IAM 14324]GAA99320.1 hypothetical protein E5Q_06015 [Mixia osmundae IAM 14324]
MPLTPQQETCPGELRNVVTFLRNKAGMKLKVGVLNGKRVDYFKGKNAVKALTSPAYIKLRNVPALASEDEAIALLGSLIPYTFYLRVDVGQKLPVQSPGASAGGSSGPTPRALQLNQQQLFQKDLCYAWFYEGSQLKLVLGGIGMVAVILAGVMFPLWPTKLRVAVWYLSIGVLGLIGLFFAIAIFRLIFYVITWLTAKPGIWIFPKLFDDVGFVESFIPLWEWDLPKQKKKRKTKEEGGGQDGEARRARKEAKRQARMTASHGHSHGNGGANEPGSLQASIEEIVDSE